MQSVTNSLNRTSIICAKCNEHMEETSPDIFYCRNGHKRILLDLVEQTKQESPKAQLKDAKRSRTIKEECPFCHKTAIVESESEIFGKFCRKFSCGHFVFKDKLAIPSGRDEKWNDFFPFQRDGIEFAENSDYRCQIGDEMGLGKTIQALGTLRYNYEALTPCLIVCEAAKVYDWKSEFRIWVGDKFTEIKDEPIIHMSGQYMLCPAFNNHIISMALLQKPKVLESIKNYGFKFLIVDESHSFKNEDAERTYALQAIARVIPHVIFLSGTSVINRVDEFFVPLNILRPSHWPSKAHMISHCDRDSKGRVLGISEWYRPRFFDLISKYVIRRTKKDAGLKLPTLRINKHLIAINTNKDLVKGYNKLVDELEKALDAIHAGITPDMPLIAIFAKLRHLVGIAKVKPTLELVKEFLDSTDPEDKIAIGVHHKAVMDFMEKGLEEYNPVCISDESGAVKMQRIEQFKSPNRRVAILSILGAGQGLNIQFCRNAITMERQWNAAKEDQFHGRFHRPVKNPDGTIKTEFIDAVDSVNIDIENAADTIDQFFDEMVELKRQIAGSTLDEDFEYNPKFLIELAERCVQTRLKLGLG